MENIFKLDFNGQQVQKQDFESLGETAGLADDRVLAELLRMAPYDGAASKGILPFGHAESASVATVVPNGATGSVIVNPFRAFVGSRVTAATSGLRNWRDIRSAVYAGLTTLGTQISISANASGNPRWDLIYATMSIEVDSASATRKVKNPVTKVITDETVALFKVNTVGVSVAAGVASATPTMAPPPVDGAGNYYIPLAWVRVPAGFNATSTVLPSDIAESTAVLSLSSSMGVSSARPASRASVATTAEQQLWGSSGVRPSLWLPASMRGSESLVIPVDTAVDADGVVLDNSRDWRNRLSKFKIAVAPSGTSPPWEGGSAFSVFTYRASQHSVSGFGQTFSQDELGKGFAAFVSGEEVSVLADTAQIGVYCDLATGELKLRVVGPVSGALALIWLELTAPFANL